MREGLPKDLAGEPQMVMVKGDIIQVSKLRDDGWAFGSKMPDANESLARQLLAVAVGPSVGASDDEIMTDTGWFPMDQTTEPSFDDLKLLQSQFGDAGKLSAPAHWDDVVDTTSVQLHQLKYGEPERTAVIQSFLSTLVPPNYNKVRVLRVHR